MFHVFKLKPLLSFLFIFLFSSFSSAKVDESINPMEMFHPNAGSYEVIDQQSLTNQDHSLQIELFIINQEEPYDNFLNIQVYVQFDGNPYQKLDRKISGNDPKTYCHVGQAQLINGKKIKKDDHPYLLIPVSRFDEQTVHCPEPFSKMEAYRL